MIKVEVAAAITEMYSLLESVAELLDHIDEWQEAVVRPDGGYSPADKKLIDAVDAWLTKQGV